MTKLELKHKPWMFTVGTEGMKQATTFTNLFYALRSTVKVHDIV